MRFEIQNRITFPMAAARGRARRARSRRRAARPRGSTSPVRPGTVKRLSFVDVRTGKFNPADVRGKVVVVGATAPVLQDLHATSTTKGGLMPGPEIHANAIADGAGRVPAALRAELR